MRLLVICPHFEPDVAPTGVVMTTIASELAAAGHELHIVTSLPWYQHHRIEPEWRGRLLQRSDTDWGRITRVHPFPTDKRAIGMRALAFAGFSALATVAAIISRRRCDAVLAMSPPLTLGLAGWLVARLRRVPFVFNIQDVFPDVAIEVGALSNPRLIGLARRLERFVYRRADTITVLSDDLRRNVEAKLAAGSSRASPAGSATSRKVRKVQVIPNFVELSRILPQDRDTRYRREFGLGDRTVVMYAGNVGFSQPLELMLAAARELRRRHDIVFVINGNGSARAGLEAAAADLDNLLFVDFQPAQRLPDVLASADIAVIVLRRGLAGASVPSKLYSTLASARPVVAAVDPGSEVARVLGASESGLVVAPDDPEAFSLAIADLSDDMERRAEMGRAGRDFIESWSTPAEVAAAYVALFADLIQARADGASRPVA